MFDSHLKLIQAHGVDINKAIGYSNPSMSKNDPKLQTQNISTTEPNAVLSTQVEPVNHEIINENNLN